MKQERRQNGRCNRVARLEKPDGLSEARDFSHGFFTRLMKALIKKVKAAMMPLEHIVGLLMATRLS